MKMIHAMTADLCDAITSAASLDELLEALRALESAIADQPDGSPLSEQRVDTLIDVSSLPLYGGDEPIDTTGVWSWDETRLLVGEGSWRECEIVNRTEEE